MPSSEAVVTALRPLCEAVATLDLSDPAGARQCLAESHPIERLGSVRALLEEARAEGWLTPKDGGEGIRFGRIAKPSEETRGLSIDVVDMEGVGLEHTHPRGEVSLALATAGDPRFDGHPEGWVVLGEGTHHAPTVTGGRMLIVYFLPDGSVKWGPRA